MKFRVIMFFLALFLCVPATGISVCPEPPEDVGDSGGAGAASSRDPNALTGPTGYGNRHYIVNGTVLPYRIDFENDAAATAPAQQVDISNDLDPNLDWPTFQLTEIGFGDTFISIPPGTSRFETTVSMTYRDVTFDVQISAGIDTGSGNVYAHFYSVDPATGLPPSVETGFLPPEDGTGRGMGQISYTINHAPDIPENTEIRNIALIVFDMGEEIYTNQIDPHDPSQGTDPDKEALVTIDSFRPQSSIVSLQRTGNQVHITWSCVDSGSGVRGYDIYSRDAGDISWQLWLKDSIATSGTFTGTNGRTYEFYSICVDNVGLWERKNPIPEARVHFPNALSPSLTISATPESITVGESSTLAWSSTNADTVEIDNGVGTFGIAGTATVSPSATTTYTVTATGLGGSVSRQVTVTVHQPPAITVSADPATIVTGDSAILTRSSTNAGTVEIDNGVGTFGPSGFATVSPLITTTYTITATGQGGSVFHQITVTVYQPPDLTVSTEPAAIVSGDSATLTWGSTNADTVEINNGVGTFGPSGTATVSPSVTTTYIVTATGPGGSVSRQVTVTVHQPPAITVSVDPAIIVTGESATLTWSSTNADSVEIDNGVGVFGVSGSATVSPSITTTYTVTAAAGPGGTATGTVQVTVKQLPFHEFGHRLVDHTWNTVQLTGNYSDPAVVATITGAHSKKTSILRIRNITSNSFEVRLQEGSCRHGKHNSDEISYIVMESGSYILTDGTRLIATHVSSSDTGTFRQFVYDKPFSTVPVVTASLTSAGEKRPAWIALRRINETGFEFKLQGKERTRGLSDVERVDFLIWEQGIGLLDDTLIEVGVAEKMSRRWQQHYFFEGFNEKPALVATPQGIHDSGPARVQVRSLDALGVKLRITGKRKRVRTRHTRETVGYIALSRIHEGEDSDGDGISDRDEFEVYSTRLGYPDSDFDGIQDGDELQYWGEDWYSDLDGDGLINLLDPDSDNDGYFDGKEIEHGYDPGNADSTPPFSTVFRAGTVVVNHRWSRVEFGAHFIQPVVVARVVSNNGRQPCIVRIDNVDSEGFDIRLREYGYLNGRHAFETISYMVMERGSYMLTNGIQIKANVFAAAGDRFTDQQFPDAFNQTPVVITSITSFDGHDAVTGRIKNIGKTGFAYLMQEQEENYREHTRRETVSYIACEPFVGMVDGLTFDVNRTGDEIRHKFVHVSYTAGFPAPPVLLTDIQSAAGMNTATTRCRNNSDNGFEVKIQEERSLDNEIIHRGEVVGFIAVQE